MAEKILAPVDPLTSMPLPVLPPAEVLVPENLENNWHHHFHPSNDPLLNSPAGLAVRHVRLQLLPAETHHKIYHNIFRRPELLPKTNQERFGQIVLSVAGYTPSHAIDVYKDDPTISTPLTKRTRRRLQSSGEIEVRGQSNIRSFIRNHLVKQDFSHVKESVIDEFLETQDILRKREIGHWLLAVASELAIEPLDPIYSQALDEGLVVTPKSNLPSLVKSHVSSQKTSEKAIKALHKRLSKERAGSLQTGVDEVQLAA